MSGLILLHVPKTDNRYIAKAGKPKVSVVVSKV